MFRHFRLVIIVLMCGAISPFSYASKPNREEYLMELEKATITLVEAANIAEKQVSGKATKVSLKKYKLGLIYKIDILDKGKKFEIMVDAMTGAVISSNEDKKIPRLISTAKPN